MNCDKNPGTTSRNYRIAWAVRPSALQHVCICPHNKALALQSCTNSTKCSFHATSVRASQFLHGAADKQLSWHSGLSSTQLPPSLLRSLTSTPGEAHHLPKSKQPGPMGMSLVPAGKAKFLGLCWSTQSLVTQSCPAVSMNLTTAPRALTQHELTGTPKNPHKHRATAAKQHAQTAQYLVQEPP